MEESKGESPDKYMKLAIQQAAKALEGGEVPVGCVFVHEESDQILAASHNLTNQTKNVNTIHINDSGDNSLRN